MSDNDRTFFLFIIDRSGSMANPPTFVADMEGGITSFLNEQRKIPGKCRVSLVDFDTEYTEVFTNVKLKDTPEIKIVPRGGTALLDAMGRSITNLRNHIKSLPKAKQPGKILVTIITDGQENSSKEWTRDKVFALVKECTKDGWEFSYLGANQDAIAEGNKYGVSSASSLTYTPTTSTVTMGAHTTSVSDWRIGNAPNVAYTSNQRDVAAGTTSSPTPSNVRNSTSPRKSTTRSPSRKSKS